MRNETLKKCFEEIQKQTLRTDYEKEFCKQNIEYIEEDFAFLTEFMSISKEQAIQHCEGNLIELINPLADYFCRFISNPKSAISIYNNPDKWFDFRGEEVFLKTKFSKTEDEILRQFMRMPAIEKVFKYWFDDEEFSKLSVNQFSCCPKCRENLLPIEHNSLLSKMKKKLVLKRLQKTISKNTDEFNNNFMRSVFISIKSEEKTLQI